MAIHRNNQVLISTIEGLGTLEGRFEGMKLANGANLGNSLRGCFSVVFQARDRLTGGRVALKFFTLDNAFSGDVYRINSFDREHVILSLVGESERCIQARSGVSIYNLPIPVPGNGIFEVPCRFFALDWVENELEPYFLQQSTLDPIDKLKLFNEIVLAVEALHVRGIFHRDLKPDNLRFELDGAKRIVKAIDLGTSARIDSNAIQQPYQFSAGAPGYASPEARCGLAGNRLVAKRTDHFALGCLLFELFNLDLFYNANLIRNPSFEALLLAMQAMLPTGTSEIAQVNDWHRAIGTFSGSVAPMPINPPGNSVPPAVVALLNEVVRSLTHFDYRNRPNRLEWVRTKIWSAIRTLENSNFARKRLDEMRQVRAIRLEKLRLAELRRRKVSHYGG